MKKILVTDGAGFIGSHLCDRLLREGNDVICLDNYFTGSKDNIRHLLGNDHFELIRYDVINPYHAEVDEIYNLACPTSPPHYQDLGYGSDQYVGLGETYESEYHASFYQ